MKTKNLLLITMLLTSTLTFGQTWNTTSPNILYPLDNNGDTANVKIGIGTDNPHTTLDVAGDASFRDYAEFKDSVRIMGDLHIGEHSLIFKHSKCDNEGADPMSYDPDKILSSCNEITLGGSQTLSTINVGIGKTNLTSTLDVFGNARFGDAPFDGFVEISNSGADGIIESYNGVLYLNKDYGNSVRIGSPNANAQLDVEGASSFNGDVIINALNNLTVDNISSSNGTININGDSDISGNLNVSGNSEILGSVAIGTTIQNGYSLAVCGAIKSTELKVEAASTWCDYVFEEDYNLRDLSEVEEFINKNKHLPEIPPAKVVEEEGIEVSVMMELMMKKIEELTLYTIEQEKRIKELETNQ